MKHFLSLRAHHFYLSKKYLLKTDTSIINEKASTTILLEILLPLTKNQTPLHFSRFFALRKLCKFGGHSGIAAGESFDSKVFSFVICKTQVVFG